jgi:hypothetical protein
MLVRRRPRDVAIAAAGGAVLSGAPSTVHAIATRRGILTAARAAGTLLPGRGDQPGLVAGAFVHVGVSTFWGLVLGVFLPRRHTVAWGALAGAGIAALDLGVIGRRRPAIAALAQAPQWADHVAFGATVGWLLSLSDAAAA